jgi:hypothetical protein
MHAAAVAVLDLIERRELGRVVLEVVADQTLAARRSPRSVIPLAPTFSSTCCSTIAPGRMISRRLASRPFKAWRSARTCGTVRRVRRFSEPSSSTCPLMCSIAVPSPASASLSQRVDGSRGTVDRHRAQLLHLLDRRLRELAHRALQLWRSRREGGSVGAAVSRSRKAPSAAPVASRRRSASCRPPSACFRRQCRRSAPAAGRAGAHAGPPGR